MLDLFNYQNPPSLLNVKVTANAKTSCIKKVVQEDGSVIYKIFTTAVPEKGKANKAIIQLLAKELNIPKSSLIITHGLTCSRKIIKIMR